MSRMKLVFKFKKENSRNYENGADQIPEGCRACGGPYPDCCDSCPLFDD